jgi:hypothetical protein
MKLYKANTGFPKAEAYWIDPTGKILPVKTIHIAEVIGTPEAFSYTREQIEEIHAEHGENLGTEGKAREEIMAALLKRGWIRIRYVPKQDSYAIQCFNLGSRQKDFLYQWAKDVIDNGFHKYADVRLDTGTEVHQTSIKDLAESVANANHRKAITYIAESWEFLEIPYTED